MAEVKLEDVTVRYGKHTVIENFSLTVKDGECFTILGPSPCGKTTVLRTIAGFQKLDNGEIKINNQVVASKSKNIFLPPEKRNIGVVFQDYAVWPHMTVGDNVYYPLQKRKIPREEGMRRVLNVLEQVRMRDYVHRLPYQLSGGQQQRVALARALVFSEQLILLDEPLCNLDANLREEMRFEIKELQKKTGITVIYVTHDQDVALAISDRIAVMDLTGKIRQVGNPEEIFKNPVDSYVFKFLGLSNFFPLEMIEDQVYLRDEGKGIPFPANVPNNIKGKKFFAACRPGNVKLTRGDGLKGLVKRVIFLGNIYEYRVAIGTREIRVQQDSYEALKEGLFKEGDNCGVNFTELRYYQELEEG